jgi:hypothetical protein
MELGPLHGFQLKARQLEHDPVLGGDLVDTVEHGVADVAADDHRAVTRGEHLARKRGRRRLPVGACDADDRPLAQPQEKVDLARDGDGARTGQVEQLGIPRHARARVHGVDSVQDVLIVAAKPQLDAVGKLRHDLAERRCILAVGDAHLLAMAGQVLRQRDSAARRADHQGGQIKRCTRAIAMSAETKPAPQNVSAIRFSDHPSWWNV